ncbi:unnamed protein product [Orchesella dallaii]|uniref:Uncharacterized protein n=1 Tax=Orchesella dallaii TaxID=48710 RepID=A0ABP1RF14_9HEXA
MFSPNALVINTVKISGSCMTLQNSENKTFNEDNCKRRSSNFSLTSIGRIIRRLSGGEIMSNSKHSSGKTRRASYIPTSPSSKLASYLNEFLESLTCIRIVNNPHIPIPQKNYTRDDKESC